MRSNRASCDCTINTITIGACIDAPDYHTAVRISEAGDGPSQVLAVIPVEINGTNELEIEVKVFFLSGFYKPVNDMFINKVEII